MAVITDPLEACEFMLGIIEPQMRSLEESLNISPSKSLEWRELKGQRDAYLSIASLIRKQQRGA
jgi:hypothetical protein